MRGMILARTGLVVRTGLVARMGLVVRTGLVVSADVVDAQLPTPKTLPGQRRISRSRACVPCLRAVHAWQACVAGMRVGSATSLETDIPRCLQRRPRDWQSFRAHRELARRLGGCENIHLTF